LPYGSGIGSGDSCLLASLIVHKLAKNAVLCYWKAINSFGRVPAGSQKRPQEAISETFLFFFNSVLTRIIIFNVLSVNEYHLIPVKK